MEKFFEKLNKRISSAKLLVWDFDGTIVNLYLDWEDLKLEACRKFLPNLNLEAVIPKYFEIEAMIGSLGRRGEFVEFVGEYESRADYGLILNTVEFIRLKSKVCPMVIFSDNLVGTIERVLKKEGLDKNFDLVVGKDSVLYSKSNPSGLELISSKFPAINKKNWVMIGDSWKDKKASEFFGVSFIDINNL